MLANFLEEGMMYTETDDLALSMARKTLKGAYKNWQKKDSGYRMCAKCRKIVDTISAVVTERESCGKIKLKYYHPECYANLREKRRMAWKHGRGVD